MRFFLFIALAAIMAACNNVMPTANHYKAAGIAAGSIGAESSSLSRGVSTGSGGTHNEITIKFQKVKALDLGLEPGQVASVAAISFFQELKEEDLKDADRIVIEFVESAVSYEKTYTITELRTAVELVKTVTQFFEHASVSEIQKSIDLLDASVITAESINGIRDVMYKTDSLYGKMDDYVIQGFVTEKWENDKWGVRVQAEAKNGTVRTEYKILVLEESKKIANIELAAYNEAEKDTAQ